MTSIVYDSIIPALVSNWKSVQEVAVELPLRHELIHQSDKTRVVRTFKQVNHLVDDNELKAGVGLLREFEVEPDATSLGVAASPTGLHPSDLPLGYLHSD